MAHPSSTAIRGAGLALAVAACLALASPAAAQLPAFPGAEGYGAYVTGGRGGEVIEVTNLNNDGPGSFREAVKASGPRIVVFRTGGVIDLEGNVVITNPDLTIAGQSAPGGGICLRGRTVVIQTDNVIMRGMRFRLGDERGGDDALRLTEAQDVIIDHCSISWASDENFSTYLDAHNVTVQWSIISEALNPALHAMAMLIGKDDATNVSIHHNLTAHNRGRHPSIQRGTETEIVNNLIYNYENFATRVQQGLATNIIRNHYIAGPANTSGRNGVSIDSSAVDEGAQIYVLGNIGPGRPADSGSEWNITQGDSAEVTRSLVLAAPESGITTHDVAEVMEVVLANAGAIAPARDSIDQRIIADVQAGTGSLIDSQTEVGGWPVYAAGVPPTDSDHDGMPDSWELDHGLDPEDPGDGSDDRNGDGYTNVEEYLNSLLSTSTASIFADGFESGSTRAWTADLGGISKLTPVGVTASSDDGNIPENTLDGDLGTRWSAEGVGEWIRYDLGSQKTVREVRIAFFKGDLRTASFDIELSQDDAAWSTVYSGDSSGTTLQLQRFGFPAATARYVRYWGRGNSDPPPDSGWNSLTEVEIYGRD